MYSWSLEEFGVLSVWCPTPANHSGISVNHKPYQIPGFVTLCYVLIGKNTLNSRMFSQPILGQPSDSAGGTFKRYLLNEAKAGNSKLISELSIYGIHYS